MSGLPDSYRRAVLERQGFTCACCGRGQDPGGRTVVFDPKAATDTVVCHGCSAAARRPAAARFLLKLAGLGTDEMAAAIDYVENRQ